MSQSDCLQVKGEDEKPVAYASIYVKKNGSILVADSSGKICVKPGAGIENGDTILTSAVGFQDLYAVYKGGALIRMQKRIVLLPEVVVVNGEGKNETWGTKRNPSPFGGFGGALGFRNVLHTTARLVFPEGEYYKAEIQSVSFYDATGKDMNVPVRIRIFSIGRDSLPAGDYLTDNVITETKGKGWLEVDLTEKGLLFPKEGLVFGVEVFADNSENYYQEKTKVEKGKKKRIVTKYGFSLAFENGRDKLTAMKIPNWGNTWFFHIPAPDGLGNLVCRVKVKVWR